MVLSTTSPHGAATARTLAREGVSLRDREKLEALGMEILGAGGQAIVVGTHLARRHHAAHLVEAAVEASRALCEEPFAGEPLVAF